MHPHDELSGGGVVHHLGALDVRAGQLRVGRLRQHVPAELPGLQVGRAVRGDVTERVVGVAVLAEPVVVGTDLDHTAAVGVQRVARGVREPGPVGDRHGDRLRLSGALEQGGAQGQHGSADGRSQTQHVHTRPSFDDAPAGRSWRGGPSGRCAIRAAGAGGPRGRADASARAGRRPGSLAGASWVGWHRPSATARPSLMFAQTIGVMESFKVLFGCVKTSDRLTGEAGQLDPNHPPGAYVRPRIVMFGRCFSLSSVRSRSGLLHTGRRDFLSSPAASPGQGQCWTAEVRRVGAAGPSAGWRSRDVQLGRGATAEPVRAPGLTDPCPDPRWAGGRPRLLGSDDEDFVVRDAEGAHRPPVRRQARPH